MKCGGVGVCVCGGARYSVVGVVLCGEVVCCVVVCGGVRCFV